MLISFNSWEMEARELINKMNEVYKKKTKLEYFCTYELFKGHKSKEIDNSYEGYIYKNNKNIYQKINTTEFIYTSEFYLKVNHSEQIMELNAAQKNVNVQTDVDGILKECSEIKLETKNGKYQLIFYFKDNIKYPYSLVKLSLDKKTYMINQLDFYYSSNQDFSKDDKKNDFHQGHLRITFSKYKEKPEELVDFFSLKRYLEVNNKVLTPVGDYKNYALVDKRKN